MEPQFYQDYKNLPVAELVKVARSPWDYLPEAVAAAERVLRERGIPAEEIAAEEWNLAQKEMLDAATKRRFSDYFDWVGEVFDFDKKEGLAERRFKVFLLLYSIWYLVSMYGVIRQISYLIRCTSCDHTTKPLIWDFSYSTYVTMGLFFVMKQKTVGWVFVIIEQFILAIIFLSRFFRLYARHEFYIDATWMSMLGLGLNVGIVVFFWKPYMLEFFKVTERSKNIAVLAGLGMGVVAVAVM